VYTHLWDVPLESTAGGSYLVYIAMMTEAGNTSEMVMNFYQTTWHNIPEYIHLH
jgi:hypothetical protein